MKAQFSLSPVSVATARRLAAVDRRDARAALNGVAKFT